MGKKEKSPNQSNVSWHYFWLWLLTLIAFWVILFAVKFDFSKNSSGAWLILFLLNILLGIVFFLRFIGSLFRSLKNKDKKDSLRYGVAALSLMVLFFTSFYTVSPIAKAYFSLSNSEVKGEQTTSQSVESAKSAQPTETSNNETPKPPVNNNVNVNTIECIGPDGKHFQTTMEECTALNEKWGEEVNYMIDCPIHQSCGGGTKRITKKECDNSTCCGVGGVWELYSSKTACKQAQDKYWQDYYDDLYSRKNKDWEEEINKESCDFDSYSTHTSPVYVVPTQSLLETFEQKTAKCKIETQNNTAQKRYECETLKYLYPHETTLDAYRNCLSELTNLEIKIYKECLAN